MSFAQRCQWYESRTVGGGYELFLVIAERIRGEWRFSERSSWDVQWIDIPPTPGLRARLLLERERQAFAQAKLASGSEPLPLNNDARPAAPLRPHPAQTEGCPLDRADPSRKGPDLRRVPGTSYPLSTEPEPALSPKGRSEPVDGRARSESPTGGDVTEAASRAEHPLRSST